MRPLLLALLVLVLLLAGFQILTDQVAATCGVGGRSMAPTLLPGDRLIVDVWSYRQRAPRAGEIVVFLGPRPESAPLIKRCASLPPAGRGRPEPAMWPGVSDAATEEGWWLLGDNPEQSWDSRTFGSVPRERIVGRVTWRYWPPSRAGRVR